MVARTTVTTYDDLDGTEGASLVSFAYEGTSYEIDLNDKNQAALGKALAEFIAAARKTGRPAPSHGRKPVPPTTRRRTDLGKIREWARKHGHEVSDRGRVSVDVQEAYDAAH